MVCIVHRVCGCLYCYFHAVCSDKQNGVSISIAVGVSVAVMLVFSMGGFILGMFAGTYRTKSRTQQATPTQSPPVPTSSHSQDRTSPEGGPVYEEIVLDEIKDIPLTGNAAYGYTH